MNQNLAMAAVGLAAVLASSAGAAVILDQQPNGTGFTSQNFSDYNAYSSTGFDDFTLLSTWDLTTLTVYGSDSAGANPGLNVSVSAWISSAPGYHSGTMISGTQIGSNLVFDLTGITLAAGTYWLSAEVERPFAGGGQWYWGVSNTTNGSSGLWQNPGGGFGLGNGLQSNNVFNGTAYDWAFTLEGTKIPAPGALALLGMAGLIGRRRR